MKFTVANLGRIKSATFDVKPLTVFVGKTNTNKTWTAYSLYGLLRSMTYFLRNQRSTAKRIVPDSNVDAAIDAVTQRTADLLATKVNEKAKAADSKDSPKYTLEVTRDSILTEAMKSPDSIQLTLDGARIAEILATEPATTKKASATLTFDWEFFLDKGQVKSLKFVADRQTITVYLTRAPKGQELQLDSFSRLDERLTAELIADQIGSHLRWMAFSLFRDCMSFPAERKAVSALLAFLEPSQHLAGVQPGGPLNVPCADFIRFLSTARQNTARRDKLKVVSLLEEEIMHGRAEFFGPPEERVFGFKGNDGTQLQLHASASLVRSLAGLDIYLRQLTSDEILVVDEPEMNAHPEAQLQLVELFAMLANEGTRVILTTHSPYFIEHLNNLMVGNRLKGEARAKFAERLKLKTADAFISPDKVSAYLFDDEGVVSPLVADGMIDVQSFAHETNYINNVASRLIENLE